MPKRKIKLRAALDNGTEEVQDKEVNITFMSMDEENIPTSDDYGIKDAVKAEKLNNALNYLAECNETVFQWLEADPKNAILFANDPLKALKSAVPEFDTSKLKELDIVFK